MCSAQASKQKNMDKSARYLTTIGEANILEHRQAMLPVRFVLIRTTDTGVTPLCS